MPENIEKYRKHLVQLQLTKNRENELIGAVQCIVEKLLNKKYQLGLATHEENRTANDQSGDILPRIKRQTGKRR